MSRRARAHRASRQFIEALESRRLLNGGQLDTSFSSDGKAQVQFEKDLTGAHVAIDGDKTLVVGSSGANVDVVMARFNFDGSLDTTFGNKGIVQIHPDGDSSNANVVNAVAIDSQGRILVAGLAFSAGLDNSMLVLRFNSNGTLDKSFDHDGIVGVDFGVLQSAEAFSIAIQPLDGKIVLAGQNSGVTTSGIAVVRLNTNGSLDTSFSGDGKEELDFGDNAQANAVAIDTSQGIGNPRIVVSGDFETGSNDSVTKMVIMRLKSNGSLDTSFDKDGKVAFSLPTDNYNTSTGVLVQSGGKVVFTGYAGPKADKNEVFIAVRLNTNGSIDNSFGDQNDGIASVGFGKDDEASSVTVGVNGRIFMGGSSIGSTSTPIAIAALTPDGLLDKSFGTGGKVTTTVSPGVDDFRSVGIGYMGNRVVVASSNFNTGTANVLRYTDINPTVAVAPITTTASEQGPTEVTFLVTRDQTLPFDTVVDFNIGGTATPPSLIANKFHTADYTLSGMTIPLLGEVGHPLPPPFVDIPAGENFVRVGLTAVDDKTPEGTETATFNIISNSAYTIAATSHVTINILDNDTSASTTLKTTADAYVQDGSDAGTNFGSSTVLEVKKGGSGFNRVTYLKFDLSSVSTIGSAQLQMFGGLSDTQDASITTSLFTVADTSWTETGIDFNNAPGLSPSPLTTATITGATAKTYSFDVTSYLQAQKAAGHNIVSFAFEDSATSNSFVKFNSKEAGSNPPALVITAPPSGVVGTFKIASPHTVPAGQSTDVAVTWTVPSGGWQQLHTIDLQLSADNGALIEIQWNQENETLALLDPQTGKFGTPQALGSNAVLSNHYVSVLLKSSSKQASGPTSPVVAVNFSLQFTNAAIGHHFSVEAAASNDNGAKTTFGLGKSISVT